MEGDDEQVRCITALPAMDGARYPREDGFVYWVRVCRSRGPVVRAHQQRLLRLPLHLLLVVLRVMRSDSVGLRGKATFGNKSLTW